MKSIMKVEPVLVLVLSVSCRLDSQVSSGLWSSSHHGAGIVSSWPLNGRRQPRNFGVSQRSLLWTVMSTKTSGASMVSLASPPLR